MSLKPCRECGKSISSEAEACPHCGAKPRKLPGIGSLIKMGIGAFLAYIVFKVAFNTTSAYEKAASSDPQASQALTRQACQASDFIVKSLNARFVDECRTRSCPYMKGVAVIHNGCSQPFGVQVKMTAYDKTGQPVASRDLWPNSINNIPPGDFTVSLDHFLDYDRRMKTFDITPLTVKQWSAR